MGMPLEQQEPPDTSAQIRSNELVKLIRKLRWIGMEEQAKVLINELTRRHAVATDSVFATPGDTD